MFYAVRCKCFLFQQNLSICMQHIKNNNMIKKGLRKPSKMTLYIQNLNMHQRRILILSNTKYKIYSIL